MRAVGGHRITASEFSCSPDGRERGGVEAAVWGRSKRPAPQAPGSQRVSPPRPPEYPRASDPRDNTERIGERARKRREPRHVLARLEPRDGLAVLRARALHTIVGLSLAPAHVVEVTCRRSPKLWALSSARHLALPIARRARSRTSCARISSRASPA